MNGSSDTAKGVVPGQEGLILQRGGEELRLEKVGDRFTTRLVAADRLAALQAAWQPRAVTPVAQGQLVEWQVAPARLEAMLAAARRSGDVRFASHVYHLQQSPQTRFYLLDQVTVQFVPELGIAAADAIATSLGLVREKALAAVANAYVFRVTQAATENPIKLANRLSREAAVLMAEPNIVVATAPLYRPQDTLYSRQWHLQNQGGLALDARAHIAAEAAWDITRGSRSVVIAIPDDAFDLNHPDLQGLGKIVAPLDLKHRDSLPIPVEAAENHGTAVAGIALAEETGSGVVGVAPGCSLMPIQTTGFLDDESIEQLFEWAIAQGAAVISCSWSPAAVYFPLSLRQRNAITRAATQGRNGKGCVIVFSAGNANRPTNGKVEERGWPRNALRGLTDWLGGFAIHPDVITVTACTSLNQKAVYSNWGPQVSVAAPSNNAPPVMALPDVGSVQPGPPVKIALKGRGIVTCDRTGAAGYEGGDYTDSFGGTSSACPIVAGVAALVLSVNPDLEAWEVKRLLQETADKIVDDGPDPQLGLTYGRYDNKGHSFWFGYGKVNAHRAVQAAQARRFSSRQLSRAVTASSDIPLTIPDNGSRSSSLNLDADGRLQDIQIQVEIEHEFLGDLSLTLIAPDGQSTLLQGRTLGRQTRLRTTYTLNTTPALRWLLNRPVQGRWQLQLVDHALANTGQLRRWQLTVGI